MWLFPGSMAQQDPPPLSPKGEKIKMWIVMVLIAQVLVAISEIILIDAMKGITEGISALILYWGMTGNNFCMILLYNLMIWVGAVQIFAQLGLYVENKIDSKDKDFEENEQNVAEGVFLVYLSLIFVFYIIALVISFLFYRECKQGLYDKILRPNSQNVQSVPPQNIDYGAIGQQQMQSSSNSMFGANTTGVVNNIRDQPQPKSFPGRGQRVGQ